MNKEQIMCRCFKVTVGDLVKEIEKGTKEFEEIQEKTNAGKGCKRCVENIKDTFYKLLDL